MSRFRHMNLFKHSLKNARMYSFLQESAEELALTEALRPSEGAFYVVRYPTGWRLFGIREDDFGGSVDHSEIWDMVSADLADKYSKKLKISAGELLNRLQNHPYGFPRGRVTIFERQQKILWGGEKQVSSVAPAIQRLFSVRRADWETDEHEQCQKEDKDAVRRILKIRENWPAASMDFGFEFG